MNTTKTTKLNKRYIVGLLVLAIALSLFCLPVDQAYAASDSVRLEANGAVASCKLTVNNTSVTQGTSVSFSTTITKGTAPSGTYITAKCTSVSCNGKSYSSSGSISTSNLSAGTYTITAYFSLIVSVEDPSVGLMNYRDSGSASVSFTVSVPEYRVTFDTNGGYRTGGGSLTQYVEKGDSAYAPTVAKTGYSFSGWSGSYSSVTSNRTITARWVDDIKPTGSLANIDGTAFVNGLTAKDFSYTATDNGSGLSYCEIMSPSSATWQRYQSGTTITASSGNGVYRFRAVDVAGNVSAESTVTLFKIESFDNSKVIQDSYKVTSWYKVTLPPRVFDTDDGDISGTYTFADYSTALAFCTAKEKAFRVSRVENGWIYVNIQNESVSQVYTTSDSLNEAVDKYAKSYISEEQKFKLGNNNYYTPVNGSFQADTSALNTPLSTMPSFLSEYATLKLLRCNDHIFTKYKYNDLTLSASVTAQLIGTDVATTTGTVIDVGFTDSLRMALTNDGGVKQGYYLITETDIIGNVERYIVYIDTQKPSLTVTVNTDETTQRNITFDESYINTYAGTLYYSSLKLNSIIDNDLYSCIKITGRNLDTIYTSTTQTPFLCFDNGYYGKYTITVYDRTQNELTFDVVIAGTPPSWHYTSLTNTTKCTVTIDVNDKYNAITMLELYKISSSGEYTKLLMDSDGTAVSQTTLSYILRDGGKYTIRVTDLYGRTTEMQPIFYKKGLPSGTLKGVTEGGTTNKSVTFSYATGNMKVYLVAPDGTKTLDASLVATYDSLAKLYSIVFPTLENAEQQYLIFLSKADDNGIFIEYDFKIDNKAPSVEIIDADNKTVEKNDNSPKAFCVKWTEKDVSARYTLNNGISSVYDNGKLLDKDGIYTFTIRDKAGNTETFTIALDKAVAWAITGNYVKHTDNKMYTCEDVRFSVLEKFTRFYMYEKTSKVEVKHGELVTTEGEYIIDVADAHGNTFIGVLVIDKTPPTYTLTGVAPNGKTKDGVKIEFEKEATATYKNSTTKKTGELKSGDSLSGHGKYVITIIDVAGNKVEIPFEIDIDIDYETNISNGVFTTGTVKFKFLEDVTTTFTKDGVEIEFSKDVSDIGSYKLTAQDVASNKLVYEWQIIPEEYTDFEKTIPSGYTAKVTNSDGDEITVENGIISLKNTGEYNIILSQNVTGDFYECAIIIDNTPPTATISQSRSSVTVEKYSKKNVTAKLTRDGQAVDFDLRKPIRDTGSYTLTLTDRLGNTNTQHFVINYKLNEWGLVVAGVGIILVIALVIIIIKAKHIKT